MIPIILLLLTLSVVCYFIITNAVDWILMGQLSFRHSAKSTTGIYVIPTENRIDIQTGFQCSAYACAYVLRHFGVDADGASLYPAMPHKMKSGYVYPKGVRKLLKRHGLNVKYCRGDLNTLKADLCKGNPVIVMIRIRPDKDWLHYVPVVGFDEESVFLAESLQELVNCDDGLCNRKVRNEDFLKLWNTAMVRQPLYKNTYFLISKEASQ